MCADVFLCLCGTVRLDQTPVQSVFNFPEIKLHGRAISRALGFRAASGRHKWVQRVWVRRVGVSLFMHIHVFIIQHPVWESWDCNDGCWRNQVWRMCRVFPVNSSHHCAQLISSLKLNYWIAPHDNSYWSAATGWCEHHAKLLIPQPFVTKWAMGIAASFVFWYWICCTF